METIKTKVDEILTKHNLDFTISKVPLMGIVGENRYNSPYFGLLNNQTNEIINTVKTGYTVSQNSEVVEMVLKGLEPFGDQLSVSKAGSLNGGRKVFLQIGIEGESKVNEDIIKRYVTVIDSNDGSTGLSIGIGDLTMSCSNQFFKFYKKGEAKFRHTATLEQKIKTIPELIKIALQESLKLIEVYNKFASTPVSKELANKLVNYILGHDKTTNLSEYPTGKALSNMDALYNNIATEMAQKGQNLWGLHSGVTRWTTHEISNKAKRENWQSESLLIGSAYKKNQQSLEFALNEIGLVTA